MRSLGFRSGSVVKNPPANAGDVGSIHGSGKCPGVEEMATHSSLLAGITPWTEEPSRLQSTGSQRVRHELTTEHSSAWRDHPGLSGPTVITM